MVIFVFAIKDKLFSLQMLDEPYCSVKADSNICIYMCHSRSGGLQPPQQATIRITIRLGAECVHSMIIQSDGGRNLIGRRTQSDWTANAKKGGALVSSAPLTIVSCVEKLSLLFRYTFNLVRLRTQKGCTYPSHSYIIL